MTAPDFTPAAIQQERERVLGLLSEVEQAQTEFAASLKAYHDYQVEHHGRIFTSMNADNYATQRAAHAALSRLEAAAPALARDYAAALGELERLRLALATLAAP